MNGTKLASASSSGGRLPEKAPLEAWTLGVGQENVQPCTEAPADCGRGRRMSGLPAAKSRAPGGRSAASLALQDAPCAKRRQLVRSCPTLILMDVGSYSVYAHTHAYNANDCRSLAWVCTHTCIPQNINHCLILFGRANRIYILFPQTFAPSHRAQVLI